MTEPDRKIYGTPGETMCQRELKQEVRAGVPHFVTGQHHAEVVGEDVAMFAVLTFVNVLGHAILVLCIKRSVEGRWEPYEAIREATVHNDFGPRKVPDDFELSDMMQTALKEAEDRYMAEQEFAEEE